MLGKRRGFRGYYDTDDFKSTINQSTASDGMIESEDTTTRTASYNQPPAMMNEESAQGLNQGLAQEGNKPQETIKEITPVALTRTSNKKLPTPNRVHQN